MRRVLILSQFMTLGGLERMIVNLCRGLRQLGTVEPAVAWYDDDGCGPDLSGALRVMGVPTFPLARPGPHGFRWNTVRDIENAVRAHQAELIHTHDLGPLVHASLGKLFSFRRPYKVVHTRHGFAYTRAKLRYTAYERVFTRMADHLCVVSEGLADPRPGCSTIPNGVSFPKQALLKPIELTRNRLAVGIRSSAETAAFAERHQADFWILYLARLHSGKGQDSALEIWNALSPALRQNAALFFVGPETEPGRKAKLRACAERCRDPDRICFAGETSTPEDWLAASDLFVSASEYEGAPLSAIEAIGSGIPSILSRIKGHEPFEKLAHLFPLHAVEDAAHLCDGIAAQTLTDRAETRAHYWKAAEDFREAAGITRMARRYAEVYDSACVQ